MASSIFHQGDLNSGISRAIQEQKLVACFVHGEDDESKKWENEWLADTTFGEDGRSLGEKISDKAVILRIEAGSKEATFLNVFCPLSTTPMLALIHNGSVLERIESGTEHDEFLATLSSTVGLGSEEHDNQAAEAGEDKAAAPETEADTSQAASEAIPTSEEVSQPAHDQPVTADPRMQQMLSERGARLEAERKKREAAERERIREANARQRATERAAEEAPNDPQNKGKQRATSEKNEQQKAREAWIFQQKKRKEEAKQERARILAQIEADKRDRKLRAEQAKEAHAAEASGAFSELPNPNNDPPVSKSGNSCSLQVRLFDGSSIRARFAPDADIATAVRTWVKETSPQGGADQPFTFRQILAPQPSRSIEVSEEHQTLRELGLVPNATLVLVPVANFTEAYAGGGTYVGSALSAAYSVASVGGSLLGSILSYVPGFGGQAGAATEAGSSSGGLYMGGTGDEQEPSNAEGARMAGSDSASSSSAPIRVKTLADQRAEAAKKQGAEFYNGNSLRFEGRDDEDASKK